MTLEDFFTLTEMKDGLSNPSRVEELLSAIKNLNEFGISSGGDAVRQCSTVASTLAATENLECLNLFVKLNGLFFLNKWLQEALSLGADIGGNVAEELINALLASFERLPIDSEIAAATGIFVTLKHLLNHEYLQIKEKAKNLSDKWNCFSDDTSELEKDETTQMDQPNGLEEAKMTNISPCQGDIGKETSDLESVGMETKSCLDAIKNSNEIMPLISSNSITATTLLGDANSPGTSLISNSNQDNSSVLEGSSDPVPKAGICKSQGTMLGGFDCQPEIPPSVDSSDSLKESEMDTTGGKLIEPSQRDISGSTLAIHEEMQVTDGCRLDFKSTDSSVLKIIDSQARSGVDDCHILKCSTSSKEKEVEKDEKGSKYRIFTGSNLKSLDGPQSSYQRMDALRTGSQTRDLGDQEAKVNKVDILTLSSSLRVAETKATEDKDQKAEFGIIEDALEVARQVAIAVEREVVHYREPFCSSPEANSGEAAGRSSGSEDAKQDNPLPAEADGNSSSAETKDHSGSGSSSKGTSEITENISTGHEKSDQDAESPKMETSAHEAASKSAINRFDFDLNEEICNEEFEGSTIPVSNMQVSVSTPVAIVASSRGTAVLPIIPLHFEGELGWKGSAATSAFRPASPRRTPNSEKTLSGSKHKSSFLEIDLNMPSGEDEVFMEPRSVKHLPASSLPSGESSMEVSSRKAEMLKLDLNRVGDEDAPVYPSSYMKIQNHNGEQSLSSASSSSARQPSTRDFDLNDNPSFLEVGCSRDFEKSKVCDASRFSKLDDPVITIMGSRMSDERKDLSNPVQHSFLPNGLNMEPLSVPRPLLSYSHAQPPAYSYGAFPNGSTVSTPQTFYPASSIPYMVDSRGATVFPQVIGSGGYNGGPSARQPFFMNVASMPPSSSGFGSFRPGFDLNSGVSLIDGGNKDSGSTRQFLLQGHTGIVEDQRQSMQPSSSGISLKRKEPEGGWEPYPYGQKHMTSWQ